MAPLRSYAFASLRLCHASSRRNPYRPIEPLLTNGVRLSR
jgi:hypothetical protein